MGSLLYMLFCGQRFPLRWLADVLVWAEFALVMIGQIGLSCEVLVIIVNNSKII